MTYEEREHVSDRRDVAPRLSPRDTRTLTAVTCVVILISFFYSFVGSAGYFIDLPGQLDYYDRLAEGFRQGHVHLRDPPHPALLEKANPFAFSNRPLWVWDASLYGGQYYLYFGPVPAVGVLAYKSITGIAHVTDQWPTEIFLIGRLVAGAGVLWLLARRWRPRPPTWLVILSVLVFGMAHPIPYVAARPHVWETALAGGQCFLFLGLFAAFLALARPKPSRVWLCFAGAMWGLAVGCRATTALAIPLLVLASIGHLWLVGRRSRNLLFDVASLGMPLFVLGIAHGLYNHARFGSPFDFGIAYQTTEQPFHGHARYVPANLFAYLMTLPEVTCRFPFVVLPAGRKIPDIIGTPPGYATFEQLGGLVFLVPWLWLIFVAIGGWWLTRAQQWRLPATILASSSPRRGGELATVEIWLFSCALALVLPAVPSLRMWIAAPRYPGDGVGGLVLLATLGAFLLWRHTAGRVGSTIASGFTLLAGAATVVVGGLIAFAVSTHPFENANPELYARIERTLSLCSAAKDDP